MASGTPKRVLLSWSSGKDSAWCLHHLRQEADIEVVGLLTTFNSVADRVAMHAVRRQLVERQAESAGLPLVSVPIPSPCSNDDYERAMQVSLDSALRQLKFESVAFGDLFLEDVRSYREEKMAAWGMEPMFPLWDMPTEKLAREMVAAGIKAHITCIDPKQCPKEYVGRSYDLELLNELPDGVDPCGENGEFHTFVHGGPMFETDIDIVVGETVERDGFVFTDLVNPKTSTSTSGQSLERGSQ